jgi:hypothetical protein
MIGDPNLHDIWTHSVDKCKCADQNRNKLFIIPELRLLHNYIIE